MFRLAVLLPFLALTPANAAEQSPRDAYAACLIGNAVLERYNGVDRNEAVARAWVTCVSLKAELTSNNDLLRLYDFVYAVLKQMPEPAIDLTLPG